MKLVTLLTLVLCLFTVLTATAVEQLPFSTFADMKPYIVAAQEVTCLGAAGGEVIFMRLETEKDAYGVLFAPDTKRVVIFFWKGNVPGAVANVIWYGSWDGEGAMKVVGEKFDPAVHRNPCTLLFLAKA